MENILQINGSFIEENTDFTGLISEIKNTFRSGDVMIPSRHHHDFPNPKVKADSTLLLMPAWNPGVNAGVKIVTVSPENRQFNLPSIQGIYIYLDATSGEVRAIIEAKSLTTKRTSATSALASSFLSREDSSSLLMIGTGALSTDLIKAHASVRPITDVYVWGRNFDKAQAVCNRLKDEVFTCTPVETINDKISTVDIVSCATLSKTPLVRGEQLHSGQHIDLVGAYTKDMRESDDAAISKASVYLDTFQGGLNESGDIVIPLSNGTINREDILGDLFELCSGTVLGRSSAEEITLFKSVGHALEDLAAATYYYMKKTNEQYL